MEAKIYKMHTHTYHTYIQVECVRERQGQGRGAMSVFVRLPYILIYLLWWRWREIKGLTTQLVLRLVGPALRVCLAAEVDLLLVLGVQTSSLISRFFRFIIFPFMSFFLFFTCRCIKISCNHLDFIYHVMICVCAVYPSSFLPLFSPSISFFFFLLCLCPSLLSYLLSLRSSYTTLFGHQAQVERNQD